MTFCEIKSSPFIILAHDVCDKPLQPKCAPDIYCCQLKVEEFANAEGGRFASDPAQVTIEKLEPGQVGCEEAPSAKAKPQLLKHFGYNPIGPLLCFGIEFDRSLTSVSNKRA